MKHLRLTFLLATSALTLSPTAFAFDSTTALDFPNGSTGSTLLTQTPERTTWRRAVVFTDPEEGSRPYLPVRAVAFEEAFSNVGDFRSLDPLVSGQVGGLPLKDVTSGSVAMIATDQLRFPSCGLQQLASYWDVPCAAALAKRSLTSPLDRLFGIDPEVPEGLQGSSGVYYRELPGYEGTTPGRNCYLLEPRHMATCPTGYSCTSGGTCRSQSCTRPEGCSPNLQRRR